MFSIYLLSNLEENEKDNSLKIEKLSVSICARLCVCVCVCVCVSKVFDSAKQINVFYAKTTHAHSLVSFP